MTVERRFSSMPAIHASRAPNHAPISLLFFSQYSALGTQYRLLCLPCATRRFSGYGARQKSSLPRHEENFRTKCIFPPKAESGAIIPRSTFNFSTQRPTALPLPA